MRYLSSQWRLIFCWIAMIAFNPMVNACQGSLKSEQSIAVTRAWIAETAPAMRELRNQGVNIVVQRYNENIATIYLTQFPGYSGQVDLDIEGWLLGPEFEILFFFMKLGKLPIQVDLKDNGTVSIGSITYSLGIRNNQDLVNYFASYLAAEILEVLAKDDYVLDVVERCNFGNDFVNGRYCFDAKRWANFDTNRVIITIKSASKKPNGKLVYEVLEIDYFKKYKEISGSNKNIVFVDSLKQLIASQPRQFTIVALLQRMRSAFVNGKPVFDAVKTTDKLWIANRVLPKDSFSCEDE